jgi:hypothetical protein
MKKTYEFLIELCGRIMLSVCPCSCCHSLTIIVVLSVYKCLSYRTKVIAWNRLFLQILEENDNDDNDCTSSFSGLFRREYTYILYLTTMLRILCLSCNAKKVGKLVRFKQKGQKQVSFLAFHKCCEGCLTKTKTHHNILSCNQYICCTNMLYE